MNADANTEPALPLKQLAAIGLLVVLLAVLFGFRFTFRSEADKEGARARILLQTVQRLQKAHHTKYGTYLPIDRERNGDVLKLDDLPGSLRVRVDTSRDAFLATVWSDPSGTGQWEAWRIDNRNMTPVRQPSLPPPSRSTRRLFRTPP